MPGDGDYARDYSQTMVDAGVEGRVRYTGESASECIECGNPIPQARREALPGVELCVGCQAVSEARR